ncbi:MAG: hypothetical protein SFY66_05585 [Oculatellaceae cyanobacterium bins.114]|nr:hypothetical protein [Oculatellaceae cyanobacterium bins.114]
MHSDVSISCTTGFTPSPTPLASPLTGSLTDKEPPNRESLRVLVIGSRRGVTSTIHALHRLGFAEVREWSPLLPAPTPGEVMSILTRYLLTDA